MCPSTTTRSRSSFPDLPASPPRPWADRVVLLAERLAQPLDDAARAEARGELWLLLCSALGRFARSQMRTLGPLTREELEDLIATKALELLHRIEGGRLVLRRDPAHDVPGFMAQVSRNAIIDVLRRERLRRGDLSDPEAEVEGAIGAATRSSGAAPSSGVEIDEMARALESCLEKLAPRARLIWIFRTFFEMSSREIASHPDVGIQAAHVDVVVGRARSAVRSCLERKGFDASHVGASGAARLWDRFVRSAPPDEETSR